MERSASNRTAFPAVASGSSFRSLRPEKTKTGIRESRMSSIARGYRLDAPSSRCRRPAIASLAVKRISRGVKLVKQQTNGDDIVVLKEDATLEDLEAEAKRLRTTLGYQIKPDKRRGTYVASHAFFQGKFVLKLVPD